jgi:predicted pyridoxine 5'-phosphate oxidase superfamily flavin-nucleotide-binding protein
MRELVDNALANECPCILATVSADGEPDIGYKGSMMIFDGESLAYWERTRRQHLKNLRENPRVVVLFRDPRTKVNWRFHGSATIHDGGPVRDQVMARVVKAELDKDPEGKGLAVVVQVDRVTNLGGELLQSR